MSDTENDAVTLGKHPRDGDEVMDEEEVGPAPAGQEEDSDDDVGPMPVPAQNLAGAKKKRKGEWNYRVTSELYLTIISVLPHERLYLEHLPSADRYYKSFMHRDVINMCIMTKCVVYCLERGSTD